MLGRTHLTLAALALLRPLRLCKVHGVELQECPLVLVCCMLSQDLLGLCCVVLFEQELLKVVVVQLHLVVGVFASQIIEAVVVSVELAVQLLLLLHLLNLLLVQLGQVGCLLRRWKLGR